jgi:hypothetical protein
MEWARHMQWVKQERIQSFDEEARKKSSLEEPRGRWEDTEIDLREIGWTGMNWINLDQDREQCKTLVNTKLNHRVL